MKKIAIITPFLANGGLEKVAVVGAQELQKTFDVTLIVMDSYLVDYSYDGKIIDLKVSLLNRNIIKRIRNVLKSVYKLRKIKKQQNFDLVISHGELANIPNVFSGDKKNILTIHEDRFAALKDTQGKFVNKIIKFIYSVKSVLKIITVSEGIRINFIDKLKIPENKITTIYNPIDVNQINQLAIFKPNKYSILEKHEIIITIGRLTYAKGQWYTLRIFKQLKTENPQLKLIILGDGEMKRKLLQLSEELNLKTFSNFSNNHFDENYDVYFLGFQKNPFNILSMAKLFVMTSLWEGFGNTIVEAMACGTPVISTACKSGPAEIINPNLLNASEIIKPNLDGYGVLMPVFKQKFIGADEELDQVEKLWIQTIQGLLTEDKMLSDFAISGLKRSENFNLMHIINTWIEVLETAIKN